MTEQLGTGLTEEELAFCERVLDRLSERMIERAKVNALPTNWHERRMLPRGARCEVYSVAKRYPFTNVP